MTQAHPLCGCPTQIVADGCQVIISTTIANPARVFGSNRRGHHNNLGTLYLEL